MNLITVIRKTPLVRLDSIVPANSAEVWVKYEGNNPTEYYEHDTAKGMIKESIQLCILKSE